MSKAATHPPYHVALDGRMAELEGGGVGVYIRHLCDYLVHQGYRVTLIASQPINHPPNGVSSLVIGGGWHWLIWEQLRLPLALWRLRPDLFHATANYGIPLLLRVPTLLTVHDIIPAIWPAYFEHARWPWLARRLYNWRLRSSCNSAKRVICTNQLVADQLIKHNLVTEEKLQIVPMGVETKLGQKVTKAEQSTLKKYQVQKPYLLAPGGLEARKNPRLLLRAFQKIYRQHPNLQLVFTGDQPDLLNSLRQEAKQLKVSREVLFVGRIPRDDILALIKQAKAIVYPTSHEGFGLPVVEAVAAGRPVVTSSLEIFHHLVGDLPIYIKHLTVTGLEQALTKSLLSPTKVSTSRPVVSWDDSSRQTSQIIERLIHPTNLARSS